MKQEAKVNRAVLVLMSLWVAGCVTVSDTPAPATPQPNVKSLSSMQDVKGGMSKEEILQKMGNPSIVGYEMVSESTREYKPLTIANPYRSEILTRGSEKYEVLYFFTRPKNADGVITDDELNPLVFKEEKLEGQ